MQNENPSSETLVGGTHVDSANGGETVSSPALTLAELNKYLGSDFKDPQTALKALKDTKDFVGKRKEDIVAEVKNSSANTPDESWKTEVQSLNSRLFYSENPQYKGFESLITKMGSNPAEVVNTNEFKSMFDKVQKADEVEQTKSVVSSNNRISQSKSAVETAINTANARGTTIEDVATVLARSINEEGARGI